ncbi:MAG: pyrroline-5-carboxylate reductase [Proteobacteria bacterium]|nr:pyrroline-5-carboxylate reductase [Pseudomonadota bacterium]
MLNVLLVGCGKMGGALARRWRESGMCRQLVIIDPQSTDVKSLQDVPTGFQPQVVVFAVKPQTLNDVIKDYAPFSKAGVLFVSIAAGKPVAFFEGHLGTQAKIVRSMPNLPAAIGQGITVAYANRNVSEAKKGWASTVLGVVGEVLWVRQESLLNPVTALSGSGPAYIFLLVETMMKAGIHIGLDPVLAEKLARQTVIGSAALAEESADVSAAALRDSVTSPGGTTEAALKVLLATPGIQELFDRALTAATKRAEELSE